MGWKTSNGRRYYYRSVREGTRVRSEYFGGEARVLAAAMDRSAAEDRLAARADAKRNRTEWDEVDRGLDELAADARRLAEQLLVANGFHPHHRSEWRKRRGRG